MFQNDVAAYNWPGVGVGVGLGVGVGVGVGVGDGVGQFFFPGPQVDPGGTGLAKGDRTLAAARVRQWASPDRHVVANRAQLMKIDVTESAARATQLL